MDFSIKDAAHMIGLTPRTLCYHESIGLLPETERTSGNYRPFNVMDTIDLVRIKRLTGFGSDLRHVRQIMDNPMSPEAAATLDAQRRVLTQQIDELQEKRTKIEETRNAQAPLDVVIKFTDLEHAWADTQSGLSVEDRLRLEIKLLAAFTDNPDRLEYEKLTRAFIEKHNDPGFRELRELDTKLEILEPDAPPEEVVILVDDYVRVLDSTRVRFAPTNEEALASAPAVEEFTCNEAQPIAITSVRKCLRSSDDKSPNPSQAPK